MGFTCQLVKGENIELPAQVTADAVKCGAIPKEDEGEVEVVEAVVQPPAPVERGAAPVDGSITPSVTSSATGAGGTLVTPGDDIRG
jgi:hypothetical protein